MSEIETRLYDQYNISISEVKALVADSGKVIFVTYCEYVLRCCTMFLYILNVHLKYIFPYLLFVIVSLISACVY